jgi:hypothetical protein
MPVMLQNVNGYVCRDCTDVARAQKGIDPTRPQGGPYVRERAQPDSVRPDAPAKLATSGDVGTRLHVVA